MLVVEVNQLQFEYDIHSLVKAFYPEAEVKVLLSERSKKEQPENLDVPAIEVTIQASSVCVTIDNTVRKEVAFLEESMRPEIKNKLKQVLYGALAEYTKKQLPWGNLTGIRPTKIPMLLLEEGMEKQQIKKRMKETYSISEEKAELSIEIAERERAILAKLHYEKGYSLYLGIPFCPTTCLYCSFTSYPISSYKKRVGDYLEALEKEIEFVAEANRDKVLDTVYIGGGTPTTLEPEELRRLLEKLTTSFCFETVVEFTVEAGRADSITREKLEVLKEYGVTRISVNPQTMKEETLRLIGRKGTPEQVKEAFALARQVGFTNINMDLILGLPGETQEDVEHTMKELKMLQPDSLTVHSLAIKRGSRLACWITENGIQTLHNTNETMEIAAKAAREMKMLPYYLYRQKNMAGNFENVGYATEGNFGIYNILIMEEKQSIVAIGAGSISKVVLPDGRIERCDSVKDVSLYIDKIAEMMDRKRQLFALDN